MSVLRQFFRAKDAPRYRVPKETELDDGLKAMPQGLLPSFVAERGAVRPLRHNEAAR